MNVCVFLGPTLSKKAASRVLDAIYLPPAAQGDVYLAANDGAQVIGIVDGYFQGAPSVWHKEILWAMSRGVHVFGSASMGALRAAELSAFGMRGVGRIFEAYRDGAISDDDEVAVVHGPHEMDYASRTDPLVNIRATLEKAVELGVLAEKDRRVLLESARSLFYWDRTHAAMIEKAKTLIDNEALAKVSGWIRKHSVDQKGDDAIEMLECIRSFQARPSNGPLKVDFQFQRTSAWENLVEETSARAGNPSPVPARDSSAGILDELRLEPLLYRQTASSLSGGEGGSGNRTNEPAKLIAALKQAGHFEALAARAADKIRLLKAEYDGLPEYADAMLTPSDVLEWYFGDVGEAALPMDLEDYAKELGLSTSGELCRLLLRELLYELAGDFEQTNGVRI